MFRISDAGTDLKRYAFSVLPDGTVHIAAIVPKSGVYVVSFSKSGSLKSRIQLQSDYFVPKQLVAFPTGEFLLSGTAGTKNSTPFTGLFDSSGKLLKTLYEPEDESLRQRAESGELQEPSTGSGNTAVWDGEAVLGSDGNAYLLRATSPGLVYVITNRGDVVRKLQVDAPSEGLIPVAIKAAPGKLAVSFQPRVGGAISNLGVIRILNNNGRPLDSYLADSPGAYAGLSGCFDGSVFTFVSGHSGEVSVTVAAAK